MAERKVVEAREPFSVSLENGTPFTVVKGDRFYSDDEVVRGRENLFGELTVRQSRPQPPTSRDSETTSAAPGSRRSVTRPAAPGKAADGSGAGA